MQYGVNPKNNIGMLIKRGDGPLASAKGHYRTISGFRVMKGKKWFFSYVERVNSESNLKLDKHEQKEEHQKQPKQYDATMPSGPFNMYRNVCQI